MKVTKSNVKSFSVSNEAKGKNLILVLPKGTDEDDHEEFINSIVTDEMKWNSVIVFSDIKAGLKKVSFTGPHRFSCCFSHHDNKDNVIEQHKDDIVLLI